MSSVHVSLLKLCSFDLMFDPPAIAAVVVVFAEVWLLSLDTGHR